MNDDFFKEKKKLYSSCKFVNVEYFFRAMNKFIKKTWMNMKRRHERQNCFADVVGDCWVIFIKLSLLYALIMYKKVLKQITKISQNR